jgi:signal transduction histidine kinase
MLPSELSDGFFKVLASLATLVVLSMLLERALVLIFDYRWYKKKLSGLGLKVPISFITAWIICYQYKFDVLSKLFEPDKWSKMGVFLTAAIVAGGSAGAITLFQGVLKFNKEAQDSLRKANLAEAEAKRMKAEAEKVEAEERKKRARDS